MSCIITSPSLRDPRAARLISVTQPPLPPTLHGQDGIICSPPDSTSNLDSFDVIYTSAPVYRFLLVCPGAFVEVKVTNRQLCQMNAIFSRSWNSRTLDGLFQCKRSPLLTIQRHYDPEAPGQIGQTAGTSPRQYPPARRPSLCPETS